MGEMAKIVEIIPDDLPEWAQEAFRKGRFFRDAVQKVQALELRVAYLEEQLCLKQK